MVKKNSAHIHHMKRGSRARRERRENPSISWGDLATGYYIAPRFPAKIRNRKRQLAAFINAWPSLGAIDEWTSR